MAAALGSDAEPERMDEPTHYILTRTDSPRELLWARLQAMHLGEVLGHRIGVASQTSADLVSHEVSLAIEPAAAREPGVIPRCPGPFGGTTIVLLPPDLPPMAK
ncbi:MAG: hypothetical protein AAGI08_12395, partial [Bacteroidota bacterium]